GSPWRPRTPAREDHRGTGAVLELARPPRAGPRAAGLGAARRRPALRDLAGLGPRALVPGGGEAAEAGPGHGQGRRRPHPGGAGRRVDRPSRGPAAARVPPRPAPALTGAARGAGSPPPRGIGGRLGPRLDQPLPHPSSRTSRGRPWTTPW